MLRPEAPQNTKVAYEKGVILTYKRGCIEAISDCAKNQNAHPRSDVRRTLTGTQLRPFLRRQMGPDHFIAGTSSFLPLFAVRCDYLRFFDSGRLLVSHAQYYRVLSNSHVFPLYYGESH